MSMCPQYKGVLIARKGKQVQVAFVGCHMWTCPVCSKTLRAQWQLKIIHGVEQLDKPAWTFWTLTAHRNARTWTNSLANLQNGWQRLSMRLRRAHGDKLHYCRVYEQHKNGRAHWHMITNLLPEDWTQPTTQYHPGSYWARKQATQCGLGWSIKVGKIANNDAPLVAAYVTKYMTKMDRPLPKNTRRIQTSQRWPKPPNKLPANMDWKHYNSLTIEDCNQFWGQGCDIVDVTNKKSVTSDDFLRSTIYELDK